MVEKVEELCSNAYPCRLPVWDLEILHYGEIGVKVFRAVELIASLGPKAVAGRREHGGCETWFGDCAGTTGRWRSTKIVSENKSTRAAQFSAIVKGTQIARLFSIHNSEWQAASREDGSRENPSSQGNFRAPPVRSIPDIVKTEVMPGVVVSVAVVIVPQVEGILR